MYFKKQLIFATFIGIILFLLFYKQYTSKKIFEECELVSVVIVDARCDEGLSKTNYSYVEFTYDNEMFRQDISKNKCKEIENEESFNMYFHPTNRAFFLPEIMEENYYKKFIVFLLIVFAISMMPYRLFLK